MSDHTKVDGIHEKSMDLTKVTQIHRLLIFGNSFDPLFPSKSRWISRKSAKSIDFPYFGLKELSFFGKFAPQTGLDVSCVTPRSETLSRCFRRTPPSHRSVFLPVHRVCFIGSAAQTREPVNSRRATHAAVSALSIARPCLGPPRKKGLPSGSPFSVAPQTGLEPVTPRLTAACSTD